MTPHELAALCAAAMPEEGLAAAEVQHVCWGDGDDRVVLGDECGAVSVTMRRFGDFVATWILLLVVHPDEQRRHRALELLAEAEAWARARGSRRMLVGGAVPWYFWPGVDAFSTPALACFEAAGYDVAGEGLNMGLDTSYTHVLPAGITLERETGAGTIELTRRVWPHWEDEAARAIELGTCIAARDARGNTVGFACHGVCRRGWIGPMGTDPDRQHGGVGGALLAALAADIKADGLDTAQISWVGPVGFYASAGATVSRVWRQFARDL